MYNKTNGIFDDFFFFTRTDLRIIPKKEKKYFMAYIDFINVSTPDRVFRTWIIFLFQSDIE